MTPPPGSLEWGLWITSIGATVLLLARLTHQGLLKAYLCFAAYLAIDLTRSVVLLFLQPNTNAYGYTYVAFEPVLWLFYVLIVLHLFNLVLQRHPALAAAARSVIFIAVGIAVVVALARLPFDFSNTSERYPWLRLMAAMRGTVVTAMWLLLIAVNAFLAWFPVPMSRNAVFYSFGLGLYFLATSLTLLIRNLLGITLTRSMSTVTLAVAAACLVAWAILMNARGETHQVTVGHAWNRGQGERLLAQLQAMDDTLRKTGRR